MAFDQLVSIATSTIRRTCLRLMEAFAQSFGSVTPALITVQQIAPTERKADEEQTLSLKNRFRNLAKITRRN